MHCGIFIVNIVSWPRKKVLSGTMVHGLKGRCVVTWYWKLIVANHDLVYFERKRIPSIIGKPYRVISVGNTPQIFFTLVYISFERP